MRLLTEKDQPYPVAEAPDIQPHITRSTLLFHQVESASKSTELFLNPNKTKYMHPSANDSVHSSDESQIEKVEYFKYLGSYKDSQHDKVWRAPICRLTKLKIYRTTVDQITIYGCDSWSLTQSCSVRRN